MKRCGLLLIVAGVVATAASRTNAGWGPGSGPYPVPSPYDYWSPSGYGYPVIPDLLGRAVELLGAINDVQDRNLRAEDWLSFTRKLIVQDIKYRQQWLNLQKQHLAQARQIRQLQLQVARLQKEVDQLRARQTQPEQGTSPKPKEAPAGQPALAPQLSSPRDSVPRSVWVRVSGDSRPLAR